MKLRITAYAVDAFRFACIMSFINVLLSRFGIYGTADKLISHCLVGRLAAQCIKV